MGKVLKYGEERAALHNVAFGRRLILLKQSCPVPEVSLELQLSNFERREGELLAVWCGMCLSSLLYELAPA